MQPVVTPTARKNNPNNLVIKWCWVILRADFTVLLSHLFTQGNNQQPHYIKTVCTRLSIKDLVFGVRRPMLTTLTMPGN
jgi:hypothetical protein